MNKQQLAQKIWASANQMRSKIEASEYKDFILGFIFYKYLSDKEIEFLKAKASPGRCPAMHSALGSCVPASLWQTVRRFPRQRRYICLCIYPYTMIFSRIFGEYSILPSREYAAFSLL